MDPSRADIILKEWAEISGLAPRPARPDRQIATRTGLRGPSIGIALVVGLVIVVAGVWLAVPHPGVPSSSAATPSPSSSAATPSPSSSAATPSPSSTDGPAIDCGTADKVECEAVVVAAVGDGPRPYATIRVEPYVPGCIRAGLCMPPYGGYGAKDLVIATDVAGKVMGWKCTFDGSLATCSVAPDEDVQPLARLSLRVVGVAHQDVVLRAAGTSWSWTAASEPAQRFVTVGHYEIATSSKACAGCTDHFPPFTGSVPPDWCGAPIDALAGARIDVTITIAPGKPCRIDVSGE